MADQTTVYHPTIPDVSYEVDSSQVDAWAEQGWLKSAPSNEVVKATKAAQDKAAKVAQAAE